MKVSVRSASSAAAGATDEAAANPGAVTVDKDGTAAAGEVPATQAVESDTRAAVRGASPIALAGLAANVANIGVTLVVARLLTTRGYGALNQLIAVFFVLSIPGSALLVGIVRRVTLWQRTGHGARVAGWAQRTRGRALVLVAIWAVIAIAIRSPLSHQLSLPNPGGLSETLIAGGFWVVLCLERALLQASHAYRALGINLLVEGISRCILTIGLVGAGFGVTGAAIAILLSVLLAEAHALLAQGIVDRRALRRAAAKHSTPAELAVSEEPGVPATVVLTDPPGFHAGLSTAPDMSAAEPSTFENKRERRTLARDLVSALTALALLAILQNFDVVLLGREQPSNAGSYAPISVACKPLVVAAFVLAGFLLPEAASRRQLGQHALRQLGVVLAVIAAPAALLIVISTAIPTQLLKFAFGPRLTAAAPAFALLACAMTLLAATVLFTHYLLAAGQHLGLVILAVGAALTVGLLLSAHGELVATARADLIGQGAVALATGLLVLHTARPHGPRRSVG